MGTYKRTGCDGFDYAMPSKRPIPECKPPVKPLCPPPPCPPPPHWMPHDCDCDMMPIFPYPEMDILPVPTPHFPEKRPPFPCPPPPYGMPRPEKVDESSRRLKVLSEKTKTLIQMIKDFEQKNKPVILTIGNNSYQFGTNTVIDFDGDAAKGMYADLICGEPIEELDPMDYKVDDTKTRVALKEPKDLLQSELARIGEEIKRIAASLNNEIVEQAGLIDTHAVLGTDEEAQ